MNKFVFGTCIGILSMLLILRAGAAYEERASLEALPPVQEMELVAEPEPAATEPPQHYTDADAVALAKMAWGECRGVEALTLNGREISGTCQKAATMWVACNRYDAGAGDSIVEIVAAPHQFAGYAADNPLDDELLALAYDVLERWNMEQNGGTDVGRVLPADYLWFTGDGKYNYFADQYGTMFFYTWELPDVYAEEG